MGTARNATLRHYLPTIAAFVLCVAALGWAQFSFAGLADSDSYFHTRAAEQISAHGFDRSFAPTVYSTWAERYGDKDLLFHLALIPFQWLNDDLVIAGKLALIALYALYFGVFAFCLQRFAVRAPWFWLLLFFLSGAGVLSPLMAVRPGALGVVFVMLEVLWLSERRGRALGLTVALHVAAHSSFVLVPGLVLVVLALDWLRGRPIWRGALLWSLGGMALGLIVNPYFPNNLWIAWDQTVQVALGSWSGGVTIPQDLFGAELRPARTNLLIPLFPVYAPALAALAFFVASVKRRISSVGLLLLATSLLLLVPSLLSERFFRFFFPLVALTGARLWSELAGEETFAELRRRGRLFYAPCLLLLACVLYGIVSGSLPAATLRARGQAAAAERLRPAIAFIQQNAAPDDLVYHNFWWDFSMLYHVRPQGRYVVALDPVFLYRHDSALFDKALAARNGASTDLFGTLARDFDARWVYLPKSRDNRGLFEGLRADRRFVKVYEDDVAVVVRVGAEAP